MRRRLPAPSPPPRPPEPPAPADPAAALPTTIVNHTGGYANGSIRYYVVGTDLAMHDQACLGPDSGLAPVSAGPNAPDGYVDAVWRKYTGRPLTILAGGTTYTERVSGGRFTFGGSARSGNHPHWMYCPATAPPPRRATA